MCFFLLLYIFNKNRQSPKFCLSYVLVSILLAVWSASWTFGLPNYTEIRPSSQPHGCQCRRRETWGPTMCSKILQWDRNGWMMCFDGRPHRRTKYRMHRKKIFGLNYILASQAAVCHAFYQCLKSHSNKETWCRRRRQEFLHV